MLAALIDVYQQTDLIYEAVSAIAASAAQAHDDNRRQVAAADRDLADIADKINRYHDAFEKGTMAEAVCGQRVAQLQERARQIRAHREELLESAPVNPAAYQIDPTELTHMQDEIFKLLQDGASGVKNALFRSLVHEIQVTGRHHIKPYFRIPENSRTPDSTSGVRILHPWAPLLGRKLNPSLVRHLEQYRDLAHDELLPAVRQASAYASPRKRGLSTRLSKADTDDLVASFENGQSRPALARQYGISVSSVGRILKRYRLLAANEMSVEPQRAAQRAGS